MKKYQGKARGGKAAAAAMTPEQRKERAMKAVAAKKELAQLPRTTHTGKLKLVDAVIPCAVLEDGTRVLTQSDFMDAMGMYYSGWIANNTLNDPDIVPAGIPHFLAQKSLIPYINRHLGNLQNIVLKYKTEKGSVAHGIKAEIIPSICDVYIDADKEIGLGKRQSQIAQRAMLLVRALAHVGIIALVDEATGYQKDRARDALARILEAYVAKELQPYIKTFDAEYYERMFKLRGLPFPPENLNNNRPQSRPPYFGKLTNDIVYRRLAPGVLDALKEEAKKAQRSSKLFQHLTPGYGRIELLKHLNMLLGLMRISHDWQEFMGYLNKASPRFNDTLPLDLEEIDR